MDTGCFHALVFVHSVAVNIRVHVSFQFIVLSRYQPRSGIAGSYGLFLVFKGTSMLFSIVAIPIYIPTNGVGGSLFSIPSPAFIVCRFFDNGHSDWCEVIPHCSFDLHFSNNDPFFCLFKTVMLVNLNLGLLDFQKHFDDIAFSCGVPFGLFCSIVRERIYCY